MNSLKGQKYPGFTLAIQIIYLASYIWFCILMLKISFQYNSFSSDVAFLRIKQDYVQIPGYLIAFYIHVYSSLLVLIAGFTQFFPVIRKKHKKIHSIAGKIYVISTLYLVAPSGFIIGLFANGGMAGRIAFCLLAILWWYFTFKAMQEIKAGNMLKHRDFMIRSFALAMSAITLRGWKYILVAVFHPHPMDVYKIIAWLGWGLNLLIAEIIIFKLNSKTQKS